MLFSLGQPAEARVDRRPLGSRQCNLLVIVRTKGIHIALVRQDRVVSRFPIGKKAHVICAARSPRACVARMSGSSSALT